MDGNLDSSTRSEGEGILEVDFDDGFLDLLSEKQEKKVTSEVLLKEVKNKNKKEGTKNQSNVNKTKDNVLLSNRNWSEFGLCRSLLKAISEMGYQNPTVIQSKVIPLALEGKDLLVTAETGSGKTASFLIPTLQRLVVSGMLKQLNNHKPTHTLRHGTKALVILPTRELAAQCFQVFKSLSKYLSSNPALLTGGIPVKEQENNLRKLPETIICTPGRALDMLMNSSSINVDNIEVVIMDEADKLLELGFRDECLQVLKFCNKNRQTMLFSATLTEDTKELVNLSLVNPVYLKVDEPTKVSKTLEFEMLMIPKEEYREACALYLCNKYCKEKTILFFQTKKSAHRMYLVFTFLKMKCGELHGNLSQSKRFESVERFKNGEIDYLLASELASRGLDIPGVKTVINVDLPTDLTRYIHRVGRTARMGTSGKAITLYVQEQRSQVKLFLKKTSTIGTKLQKNNRKIATGILNKFKEKITELEDKIKEVLLNEKIEKDIKMCDNVLKHPEEKGEIEKRKWFRTIRDKKLASKEEFVEAKRKNEKMMDTEDTSLYLHNLPENMEFGNDDVDKSKKEDDASPFDPKMSSREMRKIKYYEDMFARMDSGNKPTSIPETQTTVPTLTKTRTRSLEKRRPSESKSDKSTSSLDGFIQENVDSTYNPPLRPGRKSLYKKPVGRPPNDPDYAAAKLHKTQNDSHSVDSVFADRKSVLDNKRLIRVQSMPMVTKKPKVPLPPAVEPKQHSEPRLPSRRSKVSRWDVKANYAYVTAQTATSLNLGEDKTDVTNFEHEIDKQNESKELPLVDNLKDEYTQMVDTTVDDQVVTDLVQTDTLDQENKLVEVETSELVMEEHMKDQQLKEQPLENEEVLKEEAKEEPVETLPPEFETKIEQHYPVDELPYVVPVKKKSNRGRKAKHKRASPANVYIPEPVLVEQEKVLPADVEELPPITPQTEYIEEIKPVHRGRGKSQRARKKKQDYYEERVVSKPKYAGRSAKGPGRGHSSTDRGDKSQLQSGKRDLGDTQEEKFISIENLRMVTMEDAEKMLNLCTKKNTDLETLRKMINSVCTDSYRPDVEAKKTGEKNRFLLDPSNIIAPTLVYSQSEVETPVPENPLHISFKYRFFQDLNKF